MRLLLALLLASIVQPASAASVASVRPGDALELLPAASVLCISVPGSMTAADASAGRCLGRTSHLPAEVWYRFDISPDPAPSPHREVLLIATDIYTVKGGELAVWTGQRAMQKVATTDPLRQRTVRDGRLSLMLQRNPDAETPVVARLAIRDSRHLRGPQDLLQLATREAWEDEQSTRLFGQGLFFGLLAIMVLYNGFLYYAERNAASALYTCLLLTSGLYFAILRNMGPRFLWPQAPGLSQLLYPGVAPILAASALSFVRIYIGSGLGPQGARALRLATYACLASALFSAIVDPLASVAVAATQANIVISCALITLFICSAVAARRGSRSALFILISFIAPILGAFAQISVMQGFLRPSPLLSVGLQVGNALQITVLGVGLADRMRQLRRDRDRADAVLHLALPAKIAERLKAGETAIADRHAEVAVLFADLAGFTIISARRRPEEVVQLLDALFSEIDQLAVRHGAEKIKTIGDCYMAVAGAPHPHPNPAAALAELALELPAATERALARLRASGASVPEGVGLRVGLHLGPVVAGVLGQQKIAYDMWGDTVNTASRMESHGVVGRIQCTEAVCERLADRYELEPRGEIEVRGKGTIRTWFLTARKAQSSGRKKAVNPRT